MFVDDTALCFDAWNGLPGPYISSFVKKIGTVGLSNLIVPLDNHKAQAKCFIGFCEPGQQPIVFDASIQGEIVEPQRGDREDLASFWWHPIFQPAGCKMTYGEMSLAEKNKLSHRAKAVEKFKKYLQSKR